MQRVFVRSYKRWRFGREELVTAHTRPYKRWRFGREELVTAHTRRWPNQLSFLF